jgi:hypothetical protein
MVSAVARGELDEYGGARSMRLLRGLVNGETAGEGTG